jgi:hypothetical protein
LQRRPRLTQGCSAEEEEEEEVYQSIILKLISKRLGRRV